MKIVHLIFDLNTGGAETMLVDIINEQINTENVTIIIVNNQINEKLLDQIDKRVKVILIGRKEKSRNPIPILKLNWHLLQIKPDVIHCHDYSLVRLIAIKKNVVITLHTTGIPINYLNKYKKVFVISNAVKTDIELRCSIKPVLVYNGIHINKILQKEDYTFKTFSIVQISRLDHEIKGQEIIIEALKVMVYEIGIKNICVDFIGEGNSLAYLKKLVEEYNLNEFVNFLGMKDRKYIYKRLKDYNLLIQPSLYEGFGLTIAEAMAAKVPALVSDIEGPLEIVQGGQSGYVFRSGDSEDAAKKIQSIYLDYSNVISIANKAFKWCQINFDIGKTVHCYFLEYKIN